jgi:beta-carotene hydroxylase
MTSPEADPNSEVPVRLPSLQELGHDLLRVSMLRRVTTIGLPFAIMLGYVGFATYEWWSLAVLCVMALCFVTYGSSSHDLVHQTLGLSRGWNTFWLCLIELLSLRSGTAYRLTHLHHHGHLLDESDIEGSTAHMSLLRTLLSGPTTQLRLWVWAWAKHRKHRPALLLEAMGILTLLIAAAFTAQWTASPLVYACLVIAGSWIFPLITVYIPHIPDGQTQLDQTRLFRGTLYRIIALDHLYHLEHHLYPAVPHHHWRRLAVRLDPYFEQLGVGPKVQRK